MTLNTIAKRIDRLSGERLSGNTTLLRAYKKIEGVISPSPYKSVDRYNVRDFEMFLNTAIHHHQSILDGHESSFIGHLRDQIDEGDIVYDIGANSGYSALNIISAGGTVISFEPEPMARQLLKRNLHLNNAANQASVINYALYDGPGEMELHRSSGPHQAQHSIHPTARRQGGTITVPVETVDRIIDSHPSPNLVKIDVEGAEPGVLRGMKSTLKNHRPTVLLEAHFSGEDRIGEINMDQVNQMKAGFLEADYTVFELRDGEMIELRPDEDPTSQHWIAFPEHS